MAPLSLLLLLAAESTLIAVRDTDGICPTSAQVTRAIETRLPGVLVPMEQGVGEALVLTLTADPIGGQQALTLVDGQQRVKLRRALPAPLTGGPEECPALADTVALMVERYFQELGYRFDPAAATDRRRWELFGGATWRPGADGMAAYEARAGLGRSFGARGRVGLALVGGIEGAAQQRWPGASGHLRRFPLELRLAARFSLGSTWLETGPFAGAQLLWLDSRAGERTATDSHVIPVVGWTAGLRIPLGRAAFLRLLAGLGVAVLRYDFILEEPAPTVAFGTERVWGKMGLEAGFAFW